LMKLMPKMSKNHIQKLIRTKKIKVNKKRTEPDYDLKIDDVVNIYLYDEVIEKYQDNKIYTADDFNLDIIYEDDDLILINKKTGVLSHAANPQDYGKNIVDMMVSYLIKTNQFKPTQNSTFTPALVNRLDRNTSGIVVGAKTYDSLKYFNDLFKKHEITKIYETIVVGNLKDQTIDLALEKDNDKNKSVINSSGKKSMTKVWNVKNFGKYSLVNVDLLTGRTHQIRAHLSHINHPIIGDIKYGNREVNKYFKNKYDLNFQLLHSYKLVFPEKMEKYQKYESMVFESKRDDLFEKILNDLESKYD
ncbi:MAG: RluA family pseudouridine synthase, partial [Finegoldia magna]|nr:RluA family pseudouridine synthase [Finegoldia magna]